MKLRLILLPLLAVPCIAAGPVSSFTLVNHLPVAVKELYVTPAGDANWGRNRLDGKNGNPASLAPDAAFVLRRPADTNCIFDMRIRTADGKTEDRRNVNTCATDTVSIGAPAAAASMNPATGKLSDDPSFKLFNRAARDITELYATPSGLANWGQNRLSGTPVPPDHDRLVQIAGGGNCFFDLKLVFADKRSVERKHTNLCATTELPAP